MKTVVTGDLHLSENPRDEYRFAFLNWLLKLIEDSGTRGKSFPVDGTTAIETLIVLGDLTEEKDRHSAYLVNRIVEAFIKLAALVHIVILKGNHDYTTNPDNPFFRFLGHLTNISWYNNPIKFKDNELGNVMFLPHTRDYKTDWAKLDFKSCDLIFAHNTFAGADVGPRRMDGIPPELFGRVPVISGDIHVPQTFGNITYVGAPYTCDFGDKYEPRILVLDAKTTKSVPVAGVQKRLVEIATITGLVNCHELKEGDIVKVRIKVNPNQREAWSTMQEQVRGFLENRGIICHTVQAVGLENLGTKRDPKAPSGRTDDEILVDYGKRFGVGKDFLAVGSDLMRIK